MYRNYPKPIQQCDIIRYMLMYQYGGVYTDLDVVPNVEIDTVLAKYPNANVILALRESSLRKNAVSPSVTNLFEKENQKFRFDLLTIFLLLEFRTIRSGSTFYA